MTTVSSVLNFWGRSYLSRSFWKVTRSSHSFIRVMVLGLRHKWYHSFL